MAQANNTFTTPSGVAQYPHLSKPDTKFVPKGQENVNLGSYQTKLILSEKQAEPIIEQINAFFTEFLQGEQNKANKKELKTANPPYEQELGEDGKPTGNIILKFKSSAAYKPAIFDAKGKPMMDSNIWGGSEIRVNSFISGYNVATVGVGVGLRIRAVQVIKLVEGSAEGASRFGFEETAGYEHNTPDVFQAEELVEEPVEEPVAETKPELKVVKEPVVKPSTATDKSKDVSDIISKWGAKD